MEHILGRFVFISIGVLIGFGILWLLNSLFKGRVKANLFNAVNLFLLIAITFNFVIGLANFDSNEKYVLLNVPLIILILVYRYNKYNKPKQSSRDF